MANPVFLVVAVGLLFKRHCDAFATISSQQRRHAFASTALASSTNYLESLSAQVPLPSLPESPVTEEFDEEESTAITLAADDAATGEDDAVDMAPTAASSANFQYLPVLTLYHADAIADKVIECCTRNEFNPITVFVLDASGSPLVSKRMDGCSPVGVPDFAKAKAYACLVNKYPSRAFRDRYTETDDSAKFCQMTAMVAVSGNKMACFPGGILLKVGETIVGAVGVSGAAGDEDEYCAIRGVVEVDLGLDTVPEKPICSTVKDDL